MPHNFNKLDCLRDKTLVKCALHNYNKLDFFHAKIIIKFMPHSSNKLDRCDGKKFKSNLKLVILIKLDFNNLECFQMKKIMFN